MIRRRFAAVAAVLALALIASPAPAFAKRTLGLSTGTFEFNVAEGQTGAGELFVTNDGDEPLKVMVYAGDQVVDKKGNTTYVVPTRQSDYLTSPASWMRVQLPVSSKAIGNVPYLEMKPGEKVPVKFSFEIPKGVAPGDHQMLLFFEMFQFPNEQKAVTSNISGRLGARVRLRVQGQFDERIEVRPFSVRSLVIGDGLPYSFAIRNLGNLDKAMTVQLTALNGDEDEVASSQVMTETTVYAKSMIERTGTMRLRGGLGAYTVRLQAQYSKESSGGAQVPTSIVKERSILVIPLWLAILAVVLAGAIVLWIVWRVSSAAARRRADAPPRRRRFIPGKAARRSNKPGDETDYAEDPLSAYTVDRGTPEEE